MVYAEVLAGGKGTRMGKTDMPKQFLKLKDKPIFIYTIEEFLKNKQVDKIILCTPKVWISHAEDEIKRYIKDNSKIVVVEGGATRQDTVLKGCEYISNNFGIKEDDIIVTHDAVRPFINQRIIDENIEYARKYGAVDTVIPATDTIVESLDGETISSIPVRSNMYQGQTPQSFRLKDLVDVLLSLTDDEKQVFTVACIAFVIKGRKVYLVNGEISNIKVTTPFDLDLSLAILSQNK